MSIISRFTSQFKTDWQDIHSEARPDDSSAPESFIKLIVGLGNVGDNYKGTRHNIGFDVLEEYAKSNSFPKFKDNKKFFGLVAEKFVGGQKVILLKPTTLMNLSGKSVQAASSFYNIPASNITVVHDELDLDFGTIKPKDGGEGKSSHNGLKDISKKIGSNDYRRIRFGINSPLLQKMNATDFVLGRFSKEEQDKLNKLVKEAADLI